MYAGVKGTGGGENMKNVAGQEKWDTTDRDKCVVHFLFMV
jgi:hypothetical protein